MFFISKERVKNKKHNLNSLIRFTILVLLCLIAITLTSCGCDHVGGVATCESGGVCQRCGEEYIPKLDHDWTYSIGEKVHTPKCQRPGCGKIMGAVVHTSDSCADFGCCDICGYRYTNKIVHTFDGGYCTSCGVAVYHEYFDFKLSNDKSFYTIAGFKSTDYKDIVIPSSHRGLPVTVIEPVAFVGSELQSVTISEGIEIVGAESFKSCEKLRKIVLPSGLKLIGDSAFKNCPALEELTIPSSVENIGAGAFCYYSSDDSFMYTGGNMKSNVYEGMNYLGDETNPYLVLVCRADESRKDVVLHSDTKFVAERAFQSNDITSLKLNDGLLKIYDRAFYNCSELASALVIKDSVTHIGESAFAGCSKIPSLHLNAACSDLSSGQFARLYSLEEISLSADNKNYYVKDGCLIGTKDKALYMVVGDAVIPEDGSVTALKEYSLSNIATDCVYIPEVVTQIDHFVFIGMKATSVIISVGRKNLGDLAFSTTPLTTVYYEGTELELESMISIIKLQAGFLSLSDPTFEDAAKYYYSEEEPTEDGCFWHYVDGVPVVW